MIDVEEARGRIGDVVWYQPYPSAPQERGVITSVSQGGDYVFVLYDGQRGASRDNGQATNPAHLHWGTR